MLWVQHNKLDEVIETSRIKISIEQGEKRIFYWESNPMTAFSAGILIRAMASAIDGTVDDAVRDSAIASIMQEGSIKDGIKRSQISRATAYRKTEVDKKD